MKSWREILRPLCFVAVYFVFLIAILIFSDKFYQFLPDGIIWVPPTIVVGTFIVALLSRLRAGLLPISFVVPILGPFVGGGPDMFFPITILMFTFSTGIGVTLGLIRDRVSAAKRKCDQAEVGIGQPRYPL